MSAIVVPKAKLPGVTWQRFLVALAVAVVLPYALGGVGILNDYRASLAGTAVCLMVAAFGLNVLLGYTGQLSLGHMALVGVGAFAGAKLTGPDELRLSFLVGLPIAVGLSALSGLVFGAAALRLKGLYLAVATLVFQYAMWQSIFRIQPFSAGSGGVTFPRPWIGSYEFRADTAFLAIIAACAVLIWWVDTNLTETKLGRALRAIAADEDVASAFGISVVRYKLLAAAVAGAYAGMAGYLLGHLYLSVNNDSFDLEQSLVLVIMVVVGGRGSRVGIASAAAFFAVTPLILEELLGGQGGEWPVIVGALSLMLTVALNPGGLAAAVRENLQHRKQATDVHQTATGEAAAPLLRLPVPTVVQRSTGVHHGPKLAASGVTVRFGGLTAVEDAGLQVPTNRIVGLIGPNGAGKTTLFNAISGAVRPDSGTVHLCGADVTALPPHARAALGLGRTFQLVGLARDRSVTENLLLAQHGLADYPAALGLVGLFGVPAVEDRLRARAADALERLGFERYADTPVANLSGGQQRIVEIACALVRGPEVLMLDEPSAGMAPAAVEQLAVRLRELRDDLGGTVLLIEHNIPLVLDTCDHLYVMAEGRVIADGPPREVVSRDDVVEAYLGTAV